jgi:hypothetical protein
MTAAQRDAIASPATGLVVFNTDTNQLNVRGPASWLNVGDSTNYVAKTGDTMTGMLTLSTPSDESHPGFRGIGNFNGEVWTEIGNTFDGSGSLSSYSLRNNNSGWAFIGLGSSSNATVRFRNRLEIYTGVNHDGINLVTHNSSGDIRFYTGGTSERMRLTSTGRLGIGNSPSYPLDVTGDINSSTRLRIAGTEICTVSGCVTVSDQRLKEEIRPLDFSLEKILQLRGVAYRYKDHERFGPQQEVGLLAQEVENVFPEVVRTDEESGFKTIAYQNLIAPMIEAVKSLAKRVSDLEKVQAENEALKKENAEIKARLDRLEQLVLQLQKKPSP